MDELSKIKSSEDEAEKISKNAKTESRKKIAQAGAEADDIVAAAEKKAKQDYDALIEEGRQQAEKEYKEYLEKTKSECGSIAEKAAAKKEQAAALIAERIVRTGVNN
ncbi:MAG: hypothetical protein VB031_00950 [Eubacteriaceae bacterium]|nr:hypothetical protein [Eubacteriaceae bacterium]